MENLIEEKYSKEFVDREEARKLFWQEYSILEEEIKQKRIDLNKKYKLHKNKNVENNELTDNKTPEKNMINIHVINYHGIGGMGKTTLVNELNKEIIQKNSNTMIVYIDLEDKTINSVLDILYRIRNILNQNYNINFNKFDLALITYLKKVGRSKDSPEIKNILNSNSMIKFIGDTISNSSVPMFVLMAGLNKIASIGTNFKYKKFIQSIELEQLPNNILEDLPQYLAEDINENIEKNNKKIIFFLDTFEKLDETTIGSTAMLSKSKWLYNIRNTGIINKIKNSMFIIESREKIDFIPNIKTYELTKFDKKYTYEYLNKAGITDEKICNEIYTKYSNGMPIILSACIDSYNINTNQFEKLIFEENSQGIIERLIGSLDIDSQALVYFLSYVEKWDDNFIMENAPKCLSNFSSYRYQNIKNLSFISKDMSGNYTFDKTIGKILHAPNTNFSNNMKFVIQQTKLYLIKYYYSKLESSNGTITEKYTGLKEYIKRKILIENDEKELIKDFELIKCHLLELKKLYLFDDYTQILNILLEKYKNIIQIRNIIIEEQIDILYLTGNYKEQEIKAEEYFALDNTNIRAIEELAKSYMYNSKYNLAKEKMDEVLNKLDKTNIKDYIRVLMEASEIQSRLGEYNKVLENYKWIQENLSCIYKENELVKKEIDIKRYIAKTYSYKGDFEKAINIYKQILNIKDDNFSELDREKESLTIDELKFYNDLSNTYSNNNEFEKSLKIKNKLLEIYIELLGEDHPWTLNIKNDIGMINSHLKNYEKAIKILEEVYNKRTEILGKEHLSTIASLNNLAIVKVFYADSLTDKNKKDEIYKQSLIQLEKVYNIRKQVLKEEHQLTLKTLFNISKTLKELGKKQEALQIAERVYDIRLKIFGEKNDETIKTMELIEEIKKNI